MTSHPASRRFTAALAAVTTVLAMVPASAWASPDDGAAIVEGRVFANADGTPRTGVVVAVSAGEDAPVWESDPTGPDGAFRIEGAPAGEYAVLARDGEAVYLASANVPLRAGTNPPIALTLRPDLAPAASQGGGMSSWGKWLITGTIVIVGGFLLNEVLKDDDAEFNGSPTNPD